MVVLEESMKAQRESRGIALFFPLTLALDRGGWSTPRFRLFNPRKETRYPSYRKLDYSETYRARGIVMLPSIRGVLTSVVKCSGWSVVKCSEVLQFNDVLSNKVSNIIRRHEDNMKLMLIFILLLSHSFIFVRFCFFINICMVAFLFSTAIYVFLLLCLCILIVCLCIFIVPAGTLGLPWLGFFRAFSSVVRQMPGYNSQIWGTVRTLPKIFVLFYVLFVVCRSVYCLRVNVYCTTATGWQPSCS
jgi:hypothetical protein